MVGGKNGQIHKGCFKVRLDVFNFCLICFGAYTLRAHITHEDSHAEDPETVYVVVKSRALCQFGP
jgi:hypothetical protein